MIKIDDAGTGSSFGRAIIAIFREETKENDWFFINKKTNVADECLKILNKLGVSKEEPIFICRGHIFKGTFQLLKKEGFNITQATIDGELQDLAEDLFIKNLYLLGFSQKIHLEGKNYKKLENDLANYLYFKPELIKTIRTDNLMKSKLIKEVVRKIDRLQGEFPNLYKTMIS